MYSFDSESLRYVEGVPLCRLKIDLILDLGPFRLKTLNGQKAVLDMYIVT